MNSDIDIQKRLNSELREANNKEYETRVKTAEELEACNKKLENLKETEEKQRQYIEKANSDIESLKQLIEENVNKSKLEIEDLSRANQLKLPDGLNDVHFKNVIADCSDIDMVVNTVNDIVENFAKYSDEVKNKVIELLNDGHALDDVMSYISDNWEQIEKDAEQFWVI